MTAALGFGSLFSVTKTVGYCFIGPRLKKDKHGRVIVLLARQGTVGPRNKVGTED